jgi:hypothetical protein
LCPVASIMKRLLRSSKSKRRMRNRFSGYRCAFDE